MGLSPVVEEETSEVLWDFMSGGRFSGSCCDSIGSPNLNMESSCCWSWGSEDVRCATTAVMVILRYRKTL